MEAPSQGWSSRKRVPAGTRVESSGSGSRGKWGYPWIPHNSRAPTTTPHGLLQQLRKEGMESLAAEQSQTIPAPPAPPCSAGNSERGFSKIHSFPCTKIHSQEISQTSATLNPSAADPPSPPLCVSTPNSVSNFTQGPTLCHWNKTPSERREQSKNRFGWREHSKSRFGIHQAVPKSILDIFESYLNIVDKPGCPERYLPQRQGGLSSQLPFPKPLPRV